MNAELKAKWIDALRSGKYLQGQAYLRKDQRYCCLGVLCDLVDNTQWKARDTSGHYSYGEEYNTALLSLDMRFLAELSTAHESRLIDLNDDAQCTFLEIADYISANL